MFSNAQSEFQDLKTCLRSCLVARKEREIHFCEEITVPLVTVKQNEVEEYSKTFLFSVIHKIIFLCAHKECASSRHQ